MNAIIFTAVWGVIQMFGGVFFKKITTAKYWALAGLLLALAVNVAEFFGMPLFNVDSKGMFLFDSYSLHFNTLILGSTPMWKKLAHMHPNTFV